MAPHARAPSVSRSTPRARAKPRDPAHPRPLLTRYRQAGDSAGPRAGDRVLIPADRRALDRGQPTCCSGSRISRHLVSPCLVGPVSVSNKVQTLAQFTLSAKNKGRASESKT